MESKAYDKKTLSQIEKEIKVNNELSIEKKKDAMFALHYLKTSSRYKENPLYKNSSFKTYLMDVHNMRETTFTENIRAFTWFPKESAKFGVGLMSAIHRKCGAEKEKKVVKEINEKAKALKTPIKRGQIQAIIETHAKPVHKNPEYKSLYNNELREHQRTKDRLRGALTELTAAKDQIKRLKETIVGMRDMEPIFNAVNQYKHQDGVTLD